MTKPDEAYNRTRVAYDHLASRYSQVWSDRSLDVELIAWFNRFLTGKLSILDLGAGPGQYSRFFRTMGYAVASVDASPAMAKLSRSRETSEGSWTAVADMRQLPFRAECFDVIWACSSVVHVLQADVPDVLRGLRRILRPGGALMINAIVSALDLRVEDMAEVAGRAPVGRVFQHYPTDGVFASLLEASGFGVRDTLHRTVTSSVLENAAYPVNHWVNYACFRD